MRKYGTQFLLLNCIEEVNLMKRGKRKEKNKEKDKEKIKKIKTKIMLNSKNSKKFLLSISNKKIPIK